MTVLEVTLLCTDRLPLDCTSNQAGVGISDSKYMH